MSDPLLDKKNRPDYRCAELERVQPSIDLVRDLSGGTKVMREKGKTYLPQEPRETDANYKIRLERSVLFEAYKRTRESLVGIVFKKEIIFGEDIPEIIQTQLEDVDLCGNHLDVFAKRLFTDQFEGYAFILVEMESALPEGSTLADERNANRRPYWVRYKADQVINRRLERINGRQEFSQITFEEKTAEPDGEYGEKEVVRCRTFRKVNGVVTWELNRIDKSKPEAEQVTFESSGQISLNRIPVAVVGEIGCCPPLLGLAYLNISWWQNNSDQENILHITRVPVLVRKGVKDDGTEQVISVTGTMDLPADGDAKWLEISDTGAVKVGRDHLLDLEKRMGMAGLSVMSEKPDTASTATEIRDDSRKELSELATMARSLKDGIELALSFHAEYLGAEQGGSIELGVSEESLVLTPQHLDVLFKAVAANKLPLSAFLNAVLYLLETAGVLAEDASIEDWERQIQEAVTVSQAVGLANSPTEVPPRFQDMMGSPAIQ